VCDIGNPEFTGNDHPVYEVLDGVAHTPEEKE
jgi:hypothetical protein